MTGNLGILAVDGPMTVQDGLRLCGSLLRAVTLDRVRSSLMEATIARLEAMDGEGDRALDRLETAAGILADVGRPRSWAEFQDHAGQLHLMLNDPERAERSFRIAYETANELDDKGFLPAIAGQLGRSLVALDRLDDALAFAEISARSSAGSDVVAEVLWRGVQARVLALRGRSEAVAIASESVAIARQTEYLHLTADALIDLATVEQLVGRSDLAAQAASEARSLFEAKGDLVSSRRTARFLGNDRRDTLRA
jgi:tetratricopeptide (TPR) repeat protein